MTTTEFMMMPGPTEIPLRVLNALMRGPIAPGNPEFIAACDEASTLLQTVFGTQNEVVIFPGSGRVAVEAALGSLIEPGDRILTVNNGVFGHWLGLTVTGAGGETVELVADWRRAVDPELVREKLRAEAGIKVVAMVHNETSTGVVNPVAEIGRVVKEYGALYVADVVSSAGGDWVNADDWGVDLACAGCYKCMNCPPGLAIVGVSRAAFAAMAKRTVRQSFSFDLYKYVEMWIPPERGGKVVWGQRRHVVEPAPQLTYALLEGLKVLIEEGLRERYRKNRTAGQAIRAAVRAMGLEVWALDERSASNTVTAIVVPPGILAEDITRTMREEHGVMIAGALEEVAAKIVRIAHMSNTSDALHVIYTVRALERTLTSLGLHVPPGAGVAAATAIMEGAAHPNRVPSIPRG